MMTGSVSVCTMAEHINGNIPQSLKTSTVIDSDRGSLTTANFFSNIYLCAVSLHLNVILTPCASSCILTICSFCFHFGSHLIHEHDFPLHPPSSGVLTLGRVVLGR